jgi:signal peptide peptidase SppA
MDLQLLDELGADIGQYGALNVPDIQSYFGVWAIHEDTFRGLVNRANSIDLFKHVKQQEEEPSIPLDSDFQITNEGIAVIDIVGVLMKRQTSLAAGTSTSMARRQIRNAVNNPNVKALMLMIDSPGGQAAGTQELADDVFKASQQKPVAAFIEDLGASAAFWVASQASNVFANATALVGAIGTFTVIEDSSEMADRLGVKVHVVKAGEFKGAGTPGTPVTEEHLSEIQRIVTTLNGFFIEGIAAGRGMSLDQAIKVADGRVHVGREAQALGLIDGVKTFQTAMASLLDKVETKGVFAMADTEKISSTETAVLTEFATYDELVSECVGASPKFICSQMAVKATISEARKAWMAEQQAQIKAARDEAKVAKAAEQHSASGVATESLAKVSAGSDKGYDGDPQRDWQRMLAELCAAGMARPKAVLALQRREPELHAAYVASFGPVHHRIT